MHNLTLQYMYIMLKSLIIQNSFVSTGMAYCQNISDFNAFLGIPKGRLKQL